LELCASIQVQCWLTVLCSETRPNAKPETVSPNAKRQMTRWTIYLFFTAVLASTVVHAQTDTLVIKGTVFDKTNNEPQSLLAWVYIDSSSIKTATDINGNFILKVPNTKTITLKVTELGYKSYTVILNKKTAKKKLKIYLDRIPSMSEPNPNNK
jgi:hypothetical protein